MQILNEVEMAYRSPLVTSLKPYLGKNCFVHFGKTEKVGVLPQGKFHSDPAGVYFYSVDWLLQHRRFQEGEQYATNFPFWTVAKIVSTEGVRMSRLTDDDLMAIVQRNQWADWDEFLQNYNWPNNPEVPALKFWSYVKWCGQSSHRMSQNKALQGIPYVYDDGRGIIHGHEPDQLVVFDPRSIQIIARGNQTTHPDARMNGHRHAFVELLKQLRGQYGGELRWSGKLPSLTINNRGAEFVLTWRPGSFGGTIDVAARWGRATKHVSMGEQMFHSKTMEEVMAFFVEFIDRISVLASKGRDMFFTPAMSEKQCISGLKTLLRDKEFTFKTEVVNDRHEMTVTAEKTIGLGANEMTVLLYVVTGDEAKHDIGGTRWFAAIRMNRYHLTTARSSGSLDELAKTLTDNFRESLDSIKPNTEYGAHFYYGEELTAFTGMVASESGIKSLMGEFKDEIAQWEKFGDKKEIFRETKRIY